MGSFSDRYSSAVHSGNLRSDPVAESDVDVIAAAGFAGKRSPLAMSLLRLFVGDARAGDSLVTLMEEQMFARSRRMKTGTSRVACRDIAKAVFAWHRDGVCVPCSGHGYKIIAGTTTIGGDQCPKCLGTGKVLFDRQFPLAQLELARWMLAEVEREMATAGPAAMAALAPKLDL